MNVAVGLEHRFERTPDGAVWTQAGFAYSFWVRYLAVFDTVTVIARIRELAQVPDGWTRADGDGVRFSAVPYYVGPWQYLLKSRQVASVLKKSLTAADAIILRVGSQLAADLVPSAYKAGHPYGLEVVGDPYDVFAPGAIRHPLRPLFRLWFPHQLRWQCAHACAVAYVTERALQRRYPPARDAYATHCSSVELPDAAFLPSPRSDVRGANGCTIITVGSLAQLYKAPDILIRAVGACVRDGLDLVLIVVGDGKHRPELEALARRQGLGGRVRFLGQLPAGDAIRNQLDQADLFVLPSRQEGLPRAMIEAMARSLPCIGSTAGGIPEILPREDLVPPGSVDRLASKIGEVVHDLQRMARMSARNWQKAREYREEVLRERRVAFYRYVRDKTDAWGRQQQGSGRALPGEGGLAR